MFYLLVGVEKIFVEHYGLSQEPLDQYLRLVCSHLNAFFTQKPNMMIRFVAFFQQFLQLKNDKKLTCRVKWTFAWRWLSRSAMRGDKYGK